MTNETKAPMGTLDSHESQLLNSAIEVPASIMMWITTRPQDAVRLRNGIGKAVEASFEHPDTKMRLVTQSELKFRGQLAMDIVEHMYLDYELVITQITDVLPDLLIGVIRDHAADQQAAFVQTDTKAKIQPGRGGIEGSEHTDNVPLSAMNPISTAAATSMNEYDTGEAGLGLCKQDLNDALRPQGHDELDDVDRELE